jgi:hypothetical protein
MVVSGDLGDLAQRFKPDGEPVEIRKLQGKFRIVFPALEVDGVEIFEVPGVVDWIAIAHQAIPHIVYFLDPAPTAGALSGLMLALLPPETRADLDLPGPIDLTTDFLARLAERLVLAAAFATENGDDWEPVISSFVQPLEESVQALLMQTVRDVL